MMNETFFSFRQDNDFYLKRFEIPSFEKKN
jgi:hypothetical protein